MQILSYFGLLLIFVGCAHGYEHRFMARVDESVPHRFDSASPPSGKLLAALPFDEHGAVSACIHEINRSRDKKFRTPFIYDTLYNQMATAVLSDFHKKSFTRSNTWFKDRRALKFVLQYEKSHYKVCSAHLVVIDILDYELSMPFYLDRKIGTSELNLYAGSPPPRGEEITELALPEALSVVTELEFTRRFIEKISGGDIARDLYSRKFSTIGLAMRVDAHSINSEIRPRVFAVIIFGGKKMQDVRVPDEVKRDSYNHLNQ